jgi:hypothetical protein
LIPHGLNIRIESWNQDDTSLWLTFFPEGTDFNRIKHERSIKVSPFSLASMCSASEA